MIGRVSAGFREASPERQMHARTSWARLRTYESSSCYYGVPLLTTCSRHLSLFSIRISLMHCTALRCAALHQAAPSNSCATSRALPDWLKSSLPLQCVAVTKIASPSPACDKPRGIAVRSVLLFLSTHARHQNFRAGWSCVVNCSKRTLFSSV